VSTGLCGENTEGIARFRAVCLTQRHPERQAPTRRRTAVSLQAQSALRDAVAIERIGAALVAGTSAPAAGGAGTGHVDGRSGRAGGRGGTAAAEIAVMAAGGRPTMPSRGL